MSGGISSKLPDEYTRPLFEEEAEMLITVFWSEQDEVFIAADLARHVSAFGDTKAEALQELGAATELVQEMQEEEGWEKEPEENSVSGFGLSGPLPFIDYMPNPFDV